MLIFLLISMSLSINMLMPMMQHPLSMTLLIILQTIISCLMISPISYSFWFSYIMILIFLGGMLVLFMYITSLASNEMFKIPMKMMMTMMIMTISWMIMFFFINFMYLNIPMKIDSLNLNQINLMTELSMNIINIYNYPLSLITIITIIYLLITMIVIAKLTKIQEGPLRQTN